MAKTNSRKHGSQQSVNAAVKGICNIMRRSDCAGALQYVPELTWILFLRILDEREMIEAEEAAALGIAFTPTLEEPYRWQDWADPKSPRRLGDGEFEKFSAWDFVHDELLPHLHALKKNVGATPRQKVVSEIMGRVKESAIDTAKNFLDVLDAVHEISTESVDDTHVFTLSQVYEGLLLKMGEKGNDGGQFFTPREVIRAMVRVNGNVRIGLRDCEQHLDKVEVLWRVAVRLRPNLTLDREELERLGGTSNLHSQELAAVFESIICALYSALDGLRAFLFGIYRNVKGVQNGSNGKLFDRAHENTYGPEFAEEVRVLLAKGREEWFLRLREIRTELTHGCTGTCHLDVATNFIRYFNQGIKREGGGAFFLDDIEGVLRSFDAQVRELVHSIAGHFYRQLIPTPQFHMCGMYRGRWYGRMVAAAPNVSFADGHCLSYDWFEKEAGYFCPMAKGCPAYERKWPGGSASQHRC